MWAGSRQHIFNISWKTMSGGYLMKENLHQCFMLARVEALGSATEIHTQADRHAFWSIWSSFFHPEMVQAFGCLSQVPSHSGVSLKWEKYVV